MTPQLRLAAYAALSACARALGYPAGYAPQEKRYSAWAKEHGRLTAAQWRTRAGDVRWLELVRAVGLRPAAEAQRVSKADAIADLRRVAMQVGTPGTAPTPHEYRVHGRFAPATVRRRLAFERDESWYQVCATAGLRTVRNRPHRTHSRASVLEDYRRAALAYGYAAGGYGPRKDEFAEVAGYSVENVRAHFPGINAIAEAAGYRARPNVPPLARPRRAA